MSPLRLWRQGVVSYLLGRMVDTLTEEFDIPQFPADPVTLKRPDLAKGIEPDKLYFFGDNAARVRGLNELDLTIDPPPDLIIEVDETSTSTPGLPIFASLGIPGGLAYQRSNPPLPPLPARRDLSGPRPEPSLPPC